MGSPLDTSALTVPVRWREVAAWRAERRASDGASGAGSVVAVVVGAAIVAVAAGVTIILIGPLLVRATELPAGLAIGAAAAAVGTVLAVLAWRAQQTRRMRLERFARANGREVQGTVANPTYPGAIFAVGGSRAASDVISTTSGRRVEHGNHRYSTGSGKNRRTHSWGFLAIRLDRRLPHLVLDSRTNDGLFGGTNLPAVFDRDQVLSLEGDFDRWFRLYCPRGYERDALYVLTPDLMAELIDETSAFDVEIVDDWMFVYSPTPFDMLDPGVHLRAARIVDTVGSTTADRTLRYADERAVDRMSGLAAADTVAPAGRRLSRNSPVLAIIVVAVVVVGGWMLLQATELFAG